jgi:hypothetical protein
MGKVHILLLVACICFGCNFSALPIPSTVSADEYDVYTAWVVQRFEKDPPKELFFSASTINSKSLFTGNCAKALLRDGVSQSMVEALAKQGDTFYPLDFKDRNHMQIPWNYSVADGTEKSSDILVSGAPWTVLLGRVAFNHSHTQALFAAETSCGGLCGGGGAVLGKKSRKGWQFERVGCIVMF